MRYLVFFLVLFGFVLFVLSENDAFAENPLIDNYEKSQTVLAGKVLSHQQRHSEIIYEIQVEDYYKNPQSADVIPVFGKPAEGDNPYRFDVNDRLFLYINKRSGVYVMQDDSFKLDYDCDARGLAPPNLGALYGGASDEYVKFSDSDGYANVYKPEKSMQIQFTAHNINPLSDNATITLMVNGINQNKTVFSDQKSVTIPACDGSVPIEWSFAPPRSDNYVAQITVTSQYDTPTFVAKLVHPLIESDFSARENTGCCSLDRTVYPVPWDSISQIENVNGSLFRVIGPFMLQAQSNDTISLGGVEFSYPYYPVPTPPGGVQQVSISFQDGVGEKIGTVGPPNPFLEFTEHENPKAGVRRNSDGTFDYLLSITNRSISPLKQFTLRIPIDQIQCKEGLLVAIKASNNNPACVTQATLQKLIERDWAKSLGMEFGSFSIVEGTKIQLEGVIMDMRLGPDHQYSFFTNDPRYVFNTGSEGITLEGINNKDDLHGKIVTLSGVRTQRDLGIKVDDIVVTGSLIPSPKATNPVLNANDISNVSLDVLYEDPDQYYNRFVRIVGELREYENDLAYAGVGCHTAKYTTSDEFVSDFPSSRHLHDGDKTIGVRIETLDDLGRVKEPLPDELKTNKVTVMGVFVPNVVERGDCDHVIHKSGFLLTKLGDIKIIE